MVFEVDQLPIRNARLLRATVRGDERGAFIKTFHDADLRSIGLGVEIAEQYYSVSQRGVIRGMHFQLPPAAHEKYVYCSRGRALDVLVDLRVDSPTCGTACTINLSGFDGQVVYVPLGVAHGFQALEDDTVLHYAVTSVYAPERDAGIRWDSVDVDWAPDIEPIVSERDATFPPITQFDSPFRMAGG